MSFLSSPTQPAQKPSWQIAIMATLGCGSLAFGGALLIGGSGCTVLTNDALPDDAGVFEGGEAGGDSCTACNANACVATWALCLTSGDCLAVRACASSPSADPTTCACNAAATDAGEPRAADTYRAFATCNDARLCTTCAASCTSSCKDHIKPSAPSACEGDGGELDAGVDGSADADAADLSDAGDADASDATTAPSAPTADTCAGCADGKCGDAKRACAIGSECASFLACVFACSGTDTTCADSCATKFATGKAAALELATCTKASCASECGLGSGVENGN